ncbi:hypothetical protein H310_05443 [Aphanomyces invadans]|uniref:Uncharacterized protein n=1 Tax=Aphanomyces invadans TaxID=157072 RepID=A0A024UAU8_9STRA|nr:hypothetical protein H310_05443 [Aphanomyces invadans]ETW03007.1 hypothetical protein H310_05443 [Aphanomyces invadans]|eukprot:XP_008868391.1 hypothetical protein H310_05443 [Aphanomyces invadans]
MSIYSFPVLKMSEIVLFIRNSKLGISEEDIKNCEPAAVRRFFEAFFDVILDISKDDLTQPALSGLSVLPHPNLHEDSIPELAFFRTSKKLLEACGVTDFTWQDIQKPKLKRLRYLLSAIINFSKFKEERKLHFDKYLKTTETLLRAKQQKEDENATLRRQLEELKAKQAAEAPALQAVIDECSVMEAEINVLNTRQSLLHPEVKALKAQVAKLNDELQSLNFDIVEGKKTIRSMESKVVNSPARQRSEIASLAQQVDVAKEEVNALDGRSAELDVIHSTVSRAVRDMEKVIELLESIEADMAKVDVEKENVLKLHQEYNSLTTKAKLAVAHKARVEVYLDQRREELEVDKAQARTRMQAVEHAVASAAKEVEQSRQHKLANEHLVAAKLQEVQEMQAKMNSDRDAFENTLKEMEETYVRLERKVKSYANMVADIVESA